MDKLFSYIHLTQTPLWGKFKTSMGTPAVKVGDIQFTKHKVPYLGGYVGYAPKVNFRMQDFSFNELKRVAKEENCTVIRFDIPNIPKSSIASIDDKWHKPLKSYTVKSPKSTFSKWNILLDISLPEYKLLENLHQKTRYNSKLAAKKGVTVNIENNEKGINTLITLLKDTSSRQKFLIHPDSYYRKVFDIYNAEDKAYILVAYVNDQPLTAWMLLIDNKVIYYPYGASSNEHRNLMASSLVGWEAIKLGKRKGCEVFDLWGATNDRNSPWWGFTQFKLRYGGELVEYMDSYDLITHTFRYNIFNFSYNSFWKVRKKLLRN